MRWLLAGQLGAAGVAGAVLRESADATAGADPPHARFNPELRSQRTVILVTSPPWQSAGNTANRGPAARTAVS